MAILITGIGELVTCDDTLEGADHGEGLGILRNAAVIVGRDPESNHSSVHWLGRAGDAPAADWAIDLGGKVVLPGFVDSHSHLAFAGDRSAEFAARMTGQAYDGGGIATTVQATREASDATLRTLMAARTDEMRAQGSTTIEIKSGYGLTVEDETRSLRLAAELTDEVTFLGGHVVPPGTAEGDRAAYVDLVTGPMLDAALPYARWIDVFCEPASPHAFDAEESRRILTAGIDAGLMARVHGNQLAPGPGVQLAVEIGAASVDHCTYLSAEDIDALVSTTVSGGAALDVPDGAGGPGRLGPPRCAGPTVATLLPGVEFCTQSPFPEAAALLAAGVEVALATDCNPGTCYSTSMPFVIALAVREMGMTPAQAVRAATLTAAKALRRDDIGHVRVGSRADLAVLDAPSYLHLAYRPGVPIAKTLEV
ncbi:MAG: amidohydrolase family protein [Ornithinimicrobium sp.]